MNFDDAFERLLGLEGGYVNDPRDLVLLLPVLETSLLAGISCATTCS